MVLAPEHPLVARITSPQKKAEVEAFVLRMSRIDKAVRTDVSTEKEGVWTGAWAVNPFTKEDIPIWIANFVLADYGTGAVMSVPAHDQRDFEFAKRFGIPIRVVIQPASGARLELSTMKEAFVLDGVLDHSGPHTGKTSAQARTDIGAQARQEGSGGPTVNYHLRDWGISRQRYWGTPIPMIHCPRCGIVPVPYEQLPVLLPADAPITGTGEPPLAKVPEFVNTQCPKCQGPARRDTDTMDTFVDSSWYFARYLDPREQTLPFTRASADRWLPVDIYVGGPEHAVMHLLYFRFWTRVMRDLGLLAIDEPVRRLVTQGMVVRNSYWCEEHHYRAADGIRGEGPDARCSACNKPLTIRLEKMSKSKLNGVSPEAMFEEYGADTARLFCLFAAPPEKDIEWSDAGVAGCFGFLKRIWTLLVRHRQRFPLCQGLGGPVDEAPLSEELRAFHRLVHRTIERVTHDIEKEYQFNTAISALMELLNAAKALEALPDPDAGLPEDPGGREGYRLLGWTLRSLTLLLCPFAPHFAEEAWESMGLPGRASEQAWPDYDPARTRQDTVQIAVQVNGKLRATVEVARSASQQELEAAARDDQRVKKWIENKPVRRVIVVPGRLVNIVVG
jgi:leucyl-tRNA synthetase